MKNFLIVFACMGPALAQTAPPQTAPPLTAPAAGTPFYAPLALTRQTQRQRFLDYSIVTFGPKALVSPAFSAGIRMINPPNAYPRDWKDGGGAFGRNYGAALANRTAKETARYATGALLHEDFRYRPSASKNVWARGLHALAFTVVDKSDSGHDRLAVANILGAGANGFVGELYYPKGFNDLSHAGTRSAIAFGDFAAQNLLREFAPELGRLARKIRAPYIDIPIPEWWVKLDKH
jgi:hypothetical protein